MMWTYNYTYQTELYHHGVQGMRWGHRKSRYEVLSDRRGRLVNKQNKYISKSNTYAERLAQPNSMKRQAKAAKYKAKWEKAERTARRDRMRSLSGKDVSSRGTRRIMKAEKYKALTAKYSAKDSKLQAKKMKYDYKAAKVQKRINRIDKKIAKSQMSSKSINKGRKAISRLS